MLRKIFRDPLIAAVLIINMALIFFLIINVLNIKYQWEESEEKQAKYKFRKEFSVCAIGTDAEEEMVGEWRIGQYSSPSLDDEGMLNYCKEVFDIARQFDGNVIYYTNRCINDRKGQTFGHIKYCLTQKEDFNTELTDGSIVSKSYEQMGEGVFVPESFKDAVYSENGHDYIDIFDVRLNVLGIRKDTTLDNSDSYFLLYLYNINDDDREKLFRVWETDMWEDRLELKFESNNDNAENNYNEIKKNFVDKGYVIIRENDCMDYTNYYFKFISKTRSIIYAVLMFFAVVNCIYISKIWIMRKQREFVIRKTFGQGMLSLLCRIFSELFCLTVVTAVVVVILQFVYGALTGGIVLQLTVFNIVAILATMLGVTVINLILPLVKVARIQPAKGLKGGQ